MDPQTYLTPDQRWTVWGCNSHKEFLDRFLIKGKFHSEVPTEIRTSYEIVERLIAYNYFHYPMTEEVISKMTRIFEMAVRIKAKSLGIEAFRLSSCLKNLKNHPNMDPEMALEWLSLNDLRDFHAHPDSYNISGPMPLEFITGMLNIVNRLFSPKFLFQDAVNKLSELQQRMTCFKNGAFIFDSNGVYRLITDAQPFFISPDSTKSLWSLTPVCVGFPQTMDTYNNINPIIIRIKDIRIESDLLIALNYRDNLIIRIYRTDIEGNILAAKSYKEAFRSAEEIVKTLYYDNVTSYEYFEKQKFIYDEFWEPANQST